jgi:hypothetical protein
MPRPAQEVQTPDAFSEDANAHVGQRRQAAQLSRADRDGQRRDPGRLAAGGHGSRFATMPRA